MPGARRPGHDAGCGAPVAGISGGHRGISEPGRSFQFRRSSHRFLSRADIRPNTRRHGTVHSRPTYKSCHTTGATGIIRGAAYPPPGGVRPSRRAIQVATAGKFCRQNFIL